MNVHLIRENENQNDGSYIHLYRNKQINAINDRIKSPIRFTLRANAVLINLFLYTSRCQSVKTM